MTEEEIKLRAKIKEYLAGYTFFRGCDIEFANSKYSDEIPLYARLFMGLKITPRENTDKEGD